MLGIEYRALCLLCKISVTELHPQPLIFFSFLRLVSLCCLGWAHTLWSFCFSASWGAGFTAPGSLFTNSFGSILELNTHFLKTYFFGFPLILFGFSNLVSFAYSIQTLNVQFPEIWVLRFITLLTLHSFNLRSYQVSWVRDYPYLSFSSPDLFIWAPDLHIHFVLSSLLITDNTVESMSMWVFILLLDTDN